jgi:hypothetical protein
VGLAAAATTTKTLAFTPTTPAQSLRVSDLKSLRRLLKALGTDAAAAAGAALARTRPLPLGSVRLGPPSHLRCRSDQDDEGAADAHASGHLNSSSSSSNQGGSTAPQGARRLAEPSRPPPPRWQLSVSHGSQTVREITVAGRRGCAFVMFAGGTVSFLNTRAFFFKRYTLEPKTAQRALLICARCSVKNPYAWLGISRLSAALQVVFVAPSEVAFRAWRLGLARLVGAVNRDRGAPVGAGDAGSGAAALRFAEHALVACRCCDALSRAARTAAAALARRAAARRHREATHAARCGLRVWGVSVGWRGWVAALRGSACARTGVGVNLVRACAARAAPRGGIKTSCSIYVALSLSRSLSLIIFCGCAARGERPLPLPLYSRLARVELAAYNAKGTSHRLTHAGEAVGDAAANGRTRDTPDTPDTRVGASATSNTAGYPRTVLFRRACSVSVSAISAL